MVGQSAQNCLSYGRPRLFELRSPSAGAWRTEPKHLGRWWHNQHQKAAQLSDRMRGHSEKKMQNPLVNQVSHHFQTPKYPIIPSEAWGMCFFSALYTLNKKDFNLVMPGYVGTSHQHNRWKHMCVPSISWEAEALRSPLPAGPSRTASSGFPWSRAMNGLYTCIYLDEL